MLLCSCAAHSNHFLSSALQRLCGTNGGRTSGTLDNCLSVRSCAKRVSFLMMTSRQRTSFGFSCAAARQQQQFQSLETIRLSIDKKLWMWHAVLYCTDRMQKYTQRSASRSRSRRLSRLSRCFIFMPSCLLLLYVARLRRPVERLAQRETRTATKGKNIYSEGWLDQHQSASASSAAAVIQYMGVNIDGWELTNGSSRKVTCNVFHACTPCTWWFTTGIVTSLQFGLQNGNGLLRLVVLWRSKKVRT